MAVQQSYSVKYLLILAQINQVTRLQLLLPTQTLIS